MVLLTMVLAAPMEEPERRIGKAKDQDWTIAQRTIHLFGTYTAPRQSKRCVLSHKAAVMPSETTSCPYCDFYRLVLTTRFSPLIPYLSTTLDCPYTYADALTTRNHAQATIYSLVRKEKASTSAAKTATGTAGVPLIGASLAKRRFGRRLGGMKRRNSGERESRRFVKASNRREATTAMLEGRLLLVVTYERAIRRAGTPAEVAR